MKVKECKNNILEYISSDMISLFEIIELKKEEDTEIAENIIKDVESVIKELKNLVETIKKSTLKDLYKNENLIFVEFLEEDKIRFKTCLDENYGNVISFDFEHKEIADYIEEITKIDLIGKYVYCFSENEQWIETV